MYRFMIEEIKEKLEKRLDEGIKVEHMSVVKNNGMKREGFSISFPGEKICPMVYVEEQLDLVRKGIMTTEDVTDLIVDSIKELNKADDSIQKAVENIDKKMILENVAYQLVNREMNEYELDNLPHKEFLDLIAIYRVAVTENGSFVVKSKFLEELDISIDELDIAARENTKNEGFVVKDMRTIMAEIFEFGADEELFGEERMYVISNRTRCFGAAVMLYSKCFEELAEKIDDDLFILPSSIHEVIAIPGSFVESVESLKEMVREVNDTQVLKEERLGYNVYKYSRDTKEIGIA